jgi:hypothetical protein
MKRYNNMGEKAHWHTRYIPQGIQRNWAQIWTCYVVNEFRLDYRSSNLGMVKGFIHTKSGVFTMLKIHNVIFWVVTPYSLAVSVTNVWTQHTVPTSKIWLATCNTTWCHNPQNDTEERIALPTLYTSNLLTNGTRGSFPGNKAISHIHLALSRCGALPPPTPERYHDVVLRHRNHFNVPQRRGMAVRKFRSIMSHITTAVITQKRVGLFFWMTYSIQQSHETPLQHTSQIGRRTNFITAHPHYLFYVQASKYSRGGRWRSC